MPLYTITNKENVIECKWNCEKKHEHFLGSYESALKYFGVDNSSVKNYGRLINIVIYHQTNERTARKFSNELFDILVRAQSEHKYYSKPEDREENAFKTLEIAEDMNLIMDDQLLSKLENSERDQSRYRCYRFKEWRKKYM